MSANSKNNFYVRLTEQNKKFIVRESKKLGLTQNAFFNMVISNLRAK